MKRLACALALLAACHPEPGPARLGSVTLATTADAAYDVAFIEFKIVAAGGSCSDAPVASKIVALETEPLPDNFGLGGSGHPFADGLFVVPVGDYLACIQPLQDDGTPPTPSVQCAPASQPVTVVAGDTQEIVLVSQCGDVDQGGLDVVFALNTEPEIGDLSILPSKFIQTCEQATIFVSVTDVDDDPLSLVWEIVDQPPGAMPTLTGNDAGTGTFEADDSGTYQIRVTAEDPAHGDAVSITFPVHVSGQPCVAPDAGWMLPMGGAGDQSIYGVTTDGDGNVLATGVRPAAVCGPNVQNCTTTDSIMVLKFAPDGTLIWQRLLGNTGSDVGRAIATNEAGDVFVAGTFAGVVDFGCGETSLPGGAGSDVFLLALSGWNGACLWSEVFGGTGADFVVDVGVSKAGFGEEQVTIGGYFFSAALDIPGFSPLINQGLAGTTDMFLLRRRTADGGHVWARREGYGGSDILTSLVVGEDGHMGLSGAFDGPFLILGIGDDAVPSQANGGSFDGFVARMDHNGIPEWLISTGAPDPDQLLDVALDRQGRVVASGYLTVGGVAAPAVFNVDATGATEWVAGATSTTHGVATRVAVDAFDNVVVFGQYGGTIDWGDGPHTAQGTQDLFLVGLRASDGQAVWSLSGGSTATDLANAIHVGSGGDVIVGGAFGDDLGTGFSLAGSTPYDNGGGFDAFLGTLVP